MCIRDSIYLVLELATGYVKGQVAKQNELEPAAQ